MKWRYWELKDDDGQTLCVRKQLPLILAYAITIHKAQSLTLDFVDVDLEDIFAPGHAYVGIGRGRSLEGIHVRNFSPTKFWADQRFLDFHAQFQKQAEKL
jgi:ATP-dependent DNA helicase PIF1